jgi:hypothetical protein
LNLKDSYFCLIQGFFYVSNQINKQVFDKSLSKLMNVLVHSTLDVVVDIVLLLALNAMPFS